VTLSEFQAILGRIKTSVKNAFERILPLLSPSDTKFLVGLAIAIGLSAGVITAGFDVLIERIFHFGFGDLPGDLDALPLAQRWRFFLFPALGGLIAGPLIHYLAPDAKGEGVPQVIRAMSEKGGRMRAREGVLKALASAITIGTGGSAGREGPIVHIGAAIGSRLGQVFRLPPVTLKTMAAAGSAAGIAAAFNAPLGGMAFAIEVILGELTTGPFAMVVLSTVTAAAVSRGLHGFDRFFQIPPYQMVHWGELVLYFALGLASGVTAKLFQRAFYRIEEAFEDFQRVAPQWKPAVGGLLVGAIGFFLPGILGPGYEVMNRALNTNILWYVLLLLIPAKMLATSLTLGSGGSGGTLMPSLFLGCILGSLFGQGLQWAIPTIVDSRAYALVGMAAVFAGLVHAPLTGMLILFEMTGDYAMILPLMIATVTATLVGRTMEPNSIYVEKLVRLGVKLGKDSDASLLTSTPVGDIMTSNVKTLRSDFPIGRLGKTFNRMNLGGFPVVDAEGLLVGMVTFAEAQAAYRSEPPPPPDAPVSQIMRDSGPPLFPEDSAGEALRRMDQHNIDRLPVVDPDEPRRVAGIVSQKDLLRLYAKRIAARPRVDPV